MSGNEIRVLSGCPTDDELAALLVVLTALGGRGRDDVDARPGAAGGWQRRATGRPDRNPLYRLTMRRTP